MTGKIELVIYNHHPSLAMKSGWLERGCREALAIIGNHKGPHAPVLPELEELEISLVDNSTIAHLHEEFMGLPGPTDVITFQHGEIFVNLDYARQRAVDFGHAWQHEVLLYCLHGMLHLNGHEDAIASERETMEAAQEILWQHALNKAGPGADDGLHSQ